MTGGGKGEEFRRRQKLGRPPITGKEGLMYESGRKLVAFLYVRHCRRSNEEGGSEWGAQMHK